MSVRRLIEQIRREATRNPKKAAILGLMLLVAGYFWAPLVWGWVKPADAPVVAPSPAPSAGSTVAAAVDAGDKPVAAKPAETTATWQQLIQWMQSDVRKRSGGPAVAQRDPFQFVETETPVKKEETPAEEAQPITPESLGLALSMTVVSGRKSLARINSKTYAWGTTIEISKEGQSYRFKLIDVQPRRVVLERDGQRFELASVSKRRPGVIDVAKQEKE